MRNPALSVELRPVLVTLQSSPQPILPIRQDRQRPWSSELEGKTVLVINPFEASIKSQYSKHLAGDLLFRDASVLPNFELKIVKPPVTIAEAKPPHGSWSETLLDLQRQIDAAMPFDVALLSCGSYGVPLVGYIVRTHNVPAFYIGGSLQLMFGIRGTRWDTRPQWRHYFNRHWVYPSKDETPPGAFSVDEAAYWGPQ